MGRERNIAYDNCSTVWQTHLLYVSGGTDLIKFSEIFFRALKWAIGISVLVFFLFSFVFVGNLGPIPALVYSPLAFLVSIVIFLIIETRLAQNSDLRKQIYRVLQRSLFGIFVILIGIHMVEYFIENSRAVRMAHAPPLTDEESMLLHSTNLNLRIGVVSRTDSAYAINGFITDLEKTCLFEQIGELDQLENPDIIATISGWSYGPRMGKTFVLHLPDYPDNRVFITVFYYSNRLCDDKFVSMFCDGKTDAEQYIDRLSVELIKASQTLFGQEELRIYGSMPRTPIAKESCERTEE
jgi:hypothetical protein